MSETCTCDLRDFMEQRGGMFNISTKISRLRKFMHWLGYCHRSLALYAVKHVITGTLTSQRGLENSEMTLLTYHTAQKMKFSIKNFFSKSDQIRSFLWIWSHLLKKSLMENFIFCAVQFFMININTIFLSS